MPLISNQLRSTHVATLALSMVAAYLAPSALADSAKLFFDHPLKGTYPAHYYELDNRGNGGYGGSLALQRDASTGAMMIHLREGAADQYYFDFNLETGTIISSVNKPGDPVVYQADKDHLDPGFIGAVVTMRNRADLLRDGISGPNQNQRPDPAAKSLADYLDQVVKDDLNGGKPSN